MLFLWKKAGADRGPPGRDRFSDNRKAAYSLEDVNKPPKE
jgi:hypothetical protein